MFPCYLAFRQDFTTPGGGMYSCNQAKDRAQKITYFLVHHTNPRTCVARKGKSTLSALRANLIVKKLTFFRKIRAPESFLFLIFSFLILRQRKRANSKKYFAVYNNKYPNLSTVQLPALASKSFASESSEASNTL